MSETATRSYDASGRREAARASRARVIDAATRLFVERGWAGTAMRDVAKAAGVSVETVYGSVGSKVELLRQAMDIAVVGDDEPVPLSERPAWRTMIDGPTAHERAGAVADLLFVLNTRVALLHRALQHAAVNDEQLQELLHRDHLDIREQNRQGVRAVARREPTEAELDLVMAITGNETFLMLTEHQAHTAADYREFVATAITRLLRLEGEDQP